MDKSFSAMVNAVSRTTSAPEELRPTKAWEIHPIKLLAKR
jgi:hypothetical protein